MKVWRQSAGRCQFCLTGGENRASHVHRRTDEKCLLELHKMLHVDVLPMQGVSSVAILAQAVSLEVMATVVAAGTC